MPDFSGLTPQMWFVLVLLISTVILSLLNWLRPDVLAMLILVTIGASQLLEPEQLFSGFSSDAVIALMAVMILSAGLEKSGITTCVSRWILKISREHPNKIMALLMITSGALASFLRSLGTVALFLPIVSRIHARTSISKSRLLMPLGFCAILGSTLTMVGTSSLIVLNSVLKNANIALPDLHHALKPFHLFDVFPIGVALLTAGVIFFLLLGKRFFPQKELNNFNNGTTKAHFMKTYNKGGDIFELRLNDNSPLINATLEKVEITLDTSSSVLAVVCDNETHFPPLRNTVIRADATLAIMGTRDKVSAWAEAYGLRLMPYLNLFADTLHPTRSGLCEAVVPPSSQLIGREVRELHMRRNHHMHVLALYRGNNVILGEELKSLTLRSGDTLGMFSRWDILSDFHKNPDFVVVTTTFPKDETRPEKLPHSLLFFAIALGLVIFGHWPVSVAFFLGAMGMIMSGVLSIDEAYANINWETVFLLSGFIPLGLVMQITGTSAWLTHHIFIIPNDCPVWAIQAGLAIIATLASFSLTNIGATILLVPVALEIATRLGGDPRLYALIVAIASSNTFLISTYQVNALIAGPGGYTRQDFWKVGGAMTFLYWIIMLVTLNLLY